MAKYKTAGLEMEAIVLGSILLTPFLLGVIRRRIAPDDFGSENHRLIYRAMLELNKQSLPIDHVTLGNQLKNDDNLDRIGGAQALAGLTAEALS
tara:strand:+ start:704 stop:985 length:282 start_codon:yes stop_codon:yes gene_type:complete